MDRLNYITARQLVQLQTMLHRLREAGYLAEIGKAPVQDYTSLAGDIRRAANQDDVEAFEAGMAAAETALSKPVEEDADEEQEVEDLTTADVIAALNAHKTPEERKAAAWSRPADEDEFFDLGKLGDELDLLTGENHFPRWSEWRDEVLSGRDQRTKPVPGVPNLYVETFDNFPVKRVYYEDWMGDPKSADDLDDEFLDIGMYGLDTESQHELIAAIAALTPYAKDAAERLRPWIDHHTAKLAA